MEGTDQSSFGALLRRFRRDAELTQEELAERAGLSVRGIGYLEREGSHAPYHATVLQLAEALQLAPTDREALLSAARRRPARPLRLPPIAPPAPTPLIGREQEVREIRASLEQPSARLLTLLGPGGVGKTRLALEVAVQLQAGFPGEVAVVSLAALTDPWLVLPTVAHMLGLRESTGHPEAENLITYLEHRRLFLLLDNLEHLLPAAPSLARLIAACPQVRLLVTSRAPLRVQGEQEYPVEPLTVSDPTDVPSVQALLEYPAVALFVQRVTAVRPEFRLDDANAATVAEICRRLDGLPLALELAATRVKLFPPQVLLQRLARPLTLLTRGATDQPPRQQTLRNTIDWSYSLLSAAEQTLFARLSVFAGGCTFEAAEAVCARAGDLDLLEGLAALVDHSLVRREGKEDARFVMLETIRQHAVEKLRERGEEESIQARHARYFLRLAEEAEPEAQLGARLLYLDRELDNLRSALAWLLARDRIEEELRLASALNVFWHTRGYWSEGMRWLEDGLSRSVGVPDRIRAHALGRAGSLALNQMDLERATRLLEEALSLLRALGDHEETAFVLAYLGETLHCQGEVVQATQLVEESLRLSREVGDSYGIAMALTSLGDFAAQGRHFARAEACVREGLALYRKIGAQPRVAYALVALGCTLFEQGEHAEARACVEECLRIYREWRITGFIPDVLDILGRILCAQRELDEAAEAFAEGLRLSQEQGDTRTLLSILGHLSELAVEQRQLARAARLAGAAVAGRGATGISSLPVDQRGLEQAMKRAREALGAERFRRAWEDGSAMSLEEAVDYALHDSGTALLDVIRSVG